MILREFVWLFLSAAILGSSWHSISAFSKMGLGFFSLNVVSIKFLFFVNMMTIHAVEKQLYIL